MSPIVVAIVVSTVPLVLLGGMAAWRRKAWGALVLAVATFVAGNMAGVLVPSDLWVLPGATGLTSDLLLLVMWAVLGALARLGGPIKVPGPPVLVAMACGATLGEVPAAAILAASAQTRGGAARLALAAAAGGMVGRMGDPAVQLLSQRDPSILVMLLPLALILALLAAPRRQDIVDAQVSDLPRTVLLVAVAALALVPGLALGAVGAGIVGLCVLGRDQLPEVEVGWVLWVAVAALLGLIAIAGGVPEMGATGLELIGEQMGEWGAPGLALAGALLAALTDGTVAAVCAVGVYDSALSLNIPGAALGMAAGVAVGGFGPLIAAGAWRAGWKRWLVHVAVTVAYVWLVML